MTAQSPGPDAAARDEVGEVGPMLRTADDLRQYEREGVRLDGSMGFAWWVDGDWITATDQYFSSKALIEDYGFVLVSFDPHLTPQPDGDVVEELAEVHGTAGPYPRPEESVQDFKERVARDFLASGLVVPVGERDRAEAQVAAVRAVLGDHPAPCLLSSCGWKSAYTAILTALDTAPASPTTDQRETCGVCSKVATGLADINGQAYCHGDDEPSPTCYEVAVMRGGMLRGSLGLSVPREPFTPGADS